MSKPLIIVESPTKAKTISKFLDSKFEVEASFGHVRDLPKSKISVDVEKDFTPTYAVPPKAKETIAKLKKKVKDADRIILATDEDREGEAISWHLVQALGLGKEKDIDTGKLDNKIERIVFHEITKTAIDHALANPRKINLNLVDAQQARRILDRLVGYELSPFLWRKIRYGLSAGRVQSVAVRLIVDREREIEAFKAEEYWSIEVLLNKSGDKQNFTAKLIKIGERKISKMSVGDKADADEILKQLEKAEYSVNDLTKRDVKRNPSPPFTTSTLQQEAARKLNFSAKQTMVVAQQLYERGHITYMRTDSLNLADSALKQAQSVIAEDFGKRYVLDKPKYYTNKSKGAQEAHEAIRPTDLSKRAQDIAKLDGGQGRLYDLIWKRTLASQMPQALFEQTSADISAPPGTFRATGRIMKFDGFIRAYVEGSDEDAEPEITDMLPDLNIGDKLNLNKLSGEQHFTQPPARYTDASLVKALEAHGVGRPSTYAPTMSTIQDRDYVEKEDKRYKPTEIGIVVTDMLVKHFPEIVDINFTSKIEQDFDDIASGEKKWVPVLREFYNPFKQHLEEKEKTVEKLIEISDVKCEHCGEMMIIKFGRMGQFLACPDPESKITQPLPEEAAKIAELTAKTRDEKCPECGKEMDVKRGRWGYFLGCSNYPECKGISKIWNKTGFTCPECLKVEARKDKPGDIVEKKSRGRGKPFYACTLYPDCEVVLNKKPESEEELQELFSAWKSKPPAKKRKYGKGKSAPVKKKSLAGALKRSLGK